MSATMQPQDDAPAAAAGTAATTTAGAEQRFSLQLRLQEHYTQVVDFDLEAVTPLVVDEPAPLGWDLGPNPARVLGAAVGSCLGASLLFCLRKSRVNVTDLRTTVEGTLVRNARGRLRIGSVRVELSPVVAEADRPKLARCLELFEDFCVVTQSIREGIDVQVAVEPR